MADQELLQAISRMMDEKLAPIGHRLDGIEQRMDRIEQRMDRIEQRMDALENDMSEVKEELSEVRTGVNTLLEWADEVGGTIAFPIPKMNL